MGGARGGARLGQPAGAVCQCAAAGGGRVAIPPLSPAERASFVRPLYACCVLYAADLERISMLVCKEDEEIKQLSYSQHSWHEVRRPAAAWPWLSAHAHL